MPRPQITVTVASAPPAPSPGGLTSTTFLGYAAATGPDAPIVVTSLREVVDAGLSPAVQQQVTDLLTEGGTSVVLWRIPLAPVDLDDATQDVLDDALALVPAESFGMGQVIIPGATGTGVHSALLDHANDTGRTVLLDVPRTATAADVVAAVAPLRGRAGAERAGVIAGGVLATTRGGGTRYVPGSLVAAGLAARMDVRKGHANAMPAGVQEYGDAGLSRVGTSGADASWSAMDLDLFSDNGVSPIIARPDGAYLYDWLALTDDEDWSQLNYGRLAMQIGATAGAYLEQFLFRTIDAQGMLVAECEAGLEGEVFLPLYTARAIYGATAADAYTVQVAGVTTAAEAAAGIFRAAASVAFTPGARQVDFLLTVRRAGEAAV